MAPPRCRLRVGPLSGSAADGGEPMDYGTKFIRAFVDAYDECRQALPGEDWTNTWASPAAWDTFMLWNPDKTSVFHVAARKLALTYWEREPFRLDGAFAPLDHKPVHSYP